MQHGETVICGEYIPSEQGACIPLFTEGMDCPLKGGCSALLTQKCIFVYFFTI